MSTSTALVVVDLQNDFLHPDGAYARGAVDGTPLASAVDNAVRLVGGARRAGVPIVASRFTLFPGPDGHPLISSHLARLRPFLRAGDFGPGSWGHRSIDEVGEPDFVVDKVAYSAFAHTQLEWWLRRSGIGALAICGIVTNGGVASTVRSAHVSDFDVTLVSDASAAFRPDIHDATVTSLGSVVSVATTDEMIAAWT